MPIFEYRCRRCKKRFEKLVFRRETSVSCPHCAAGDVEKLFSSFATVGSTKGKGNSCGSCKSTNCSTCK